MMPPNVQQVLTIIERIVRAIVTEHDQFEFKHTYEGGTLKIKMRANLADVKRLVGKNGAHISALLCVAWTIGSALGVRSIDIDKIGVAAEYDELPFRKFVPLVGADVTPLADLIRDIADIIWPQQNDVCIIDRNSSASDIYVRVDSDHDNVVENLSHSLRSLFMTVGINIGRLCYVTVEGNGAEDWREADAARRATRSIHVSGSVADKGVEKIPREHRRELGKRDLHVRGLRGSAKPASATDWRPGRTT